jgi:hypothetical protein
LTVPTAMSLSLQAEQADNKYYRLIGAGLPPDLP